MLLLCVSISKFILYYHKLNVQLLQNLQGKENLLLLGEISLYTNEQSVRGYSTPVPLFEASLVSRYLLIPLIQQDIIFRSGCSQALRTRIHGVSSSVSRRCCMSLHANAKGRDCQAPEDSYWEAHMRNRRWRK